jgi:hypothetical protein
MTPTVLILAIAFVFLAAMKSNMSGVLKLLLGLRRSALTARREAASHHARSYHTPYGGRIYGSSTEAVVGLPTYPSRWPPYHTSPLWLGRGQPTTTKAGRLVNNTLCRWVFPAFCWSKLCRALRCCAGPCG